MVYVNSDGTVTKQAPFSLQLMFSWFWGILNFITMFFRTLINPTETKHDSRYSSDYQPPGGGPPRPANRFKGLGSSGGPGAPPPPGCGCGG